MLNQLTGKENHVSVNSKLIYSNEYPFNVYFAWVKGTNKLAFKSGTKHKIQIKSEFDFQSLKCTWGYKMRVSKELLFYFIFYFNSWKIMHLLLNRNNNVSNNDKKNIFYN